MTIVRCTSKLLKRLKQPAKMPPPTPSTSPIGDWYADVDFLDREPYVVLLNASTGIALVLSARAADLRQLHINAGQQFFKLLLHFGFDLDAPKVTSALLDWETPPVFANTCDRSLLGSMKRYKEDVWYQLADHDRSLMEAATFQWEGLFRHPSLAPPDRPYGTNAWQQPLALLRSALTN